MGCSTGAREPFSAVQVARDDFAQRLIFTTRTGAPVDTAKVRRQYQKILEAAGLPKMRFYDLRHKHASLLIAEGYIRS
jgi:integrase